MNSASKHAISPNKPHLPNLTHVTQIILDQLQRAPCATPYPHISPKEPHLPHQTHISDQKSPICHTLPTYQPKRAPSARPESHELRIYSISPFNTIYNDVAKRDPTLMNSEYIYSISPFNTICNDMAKRDPTHVNSEYTQAAPSRRSVTM